MTTPAERAVLNMHRAQRRTYGKTVTYRRGIQEVELTAVLGESEFPRTDSEGLTTEEISQDFILMVSELILDEVAVEPEPGDQIEVDGFGTFAVRSPGGSEPAWRFSDPTRKLYRIHTQEV